MDELRELLETILENFDIEADIVFSEEDDHLAVDIHGRDVALLIGFRGQTLAALQCILNAVANKGAAEYCRVVLDIEGYRQRQEQNLRELAERAAERVSVEGRPVTLRAMTPYERRIVHLTLQDYPNVETSSDGEEPDRKITVSPAESEPQDS